MGRCNVADKYWTLNGSEHLPRPHLGPLGETRHLGKG